MVRYPAAIGGPISFNDEFIHLGKKHFLDLFELRQRRATKLQMKLCIIYFMNEVSKPIYDHYMFICKMSINDSSCSS